LPHPAPVGRSEERYKELADSFPQVVAETDARGNLTFVNANSFKVFGYSKEDFEKGLNVLDMIFPDDHARAKEHIGRVLKGEKIGGSRYTAVRKDGTTFPVTIYSSRALSGGKPSGMRSIVIDETERVHMEEALRDSEERYRSIFENSVEGIYQASPDGRYIQVNPALARMHGFESPEEMMKSVTDIGTQIFTNPAVLRRYRKIVEKEDAVVSFEFELYRKDRSRMWVSTSARAIRGDNGEVLYYEGTVEDITERKEAEERLRESEALARTLLNMPSNNVVVLLDRDGNTLDFNENLPKRLALSGGVPRREPTREELIHKEAVGFLAPEVAELRKNKIKEVVATGKPVRFEDYDNGIWYDNVIHPIPDEKNRVARIAVFAYDITPIKKAEEELRQHRDHLEQLVAERTAALADSEKRYRELVDNAVVGVYQNTTGGEILYHNDYLIHMLGFDSLDELKASKSPLRRKDPADREIHLQVLKEQGKLTSYETEFLTRKGQTLNVLISASVNGDVISGMIMDITDRKRAEEELRARTEQLNESNVALKVLLDQRDKDRQDMEERFISNVKHLVLPYLEDLSGMSLGSRQETLVSIARANLDQIVSPFLKNMHYQYTGFTPAELRVAGFIKDGKTVKEIANILGVSEAAINSHRQHIRNKLGLKDKKVNLRAHLQSLGAMPR